MSEMMLEALYTKLTAVQTAGTLHAAVNGRIVREQGQQNIDLPYVSFFPVTGEPMRYLTGQKQLRLRVQFDIYAKRSAGGEAAGDIEELLYDLLEGVSITPTGFDRGVCTFVNRFSQSIEEDAIRIIDEIIIEGTEAP